jgi:hypothetical protein
MNKRCAGRNHNLSRCSRTINSSFFCVDHKYQWLVFLIFLVFTVGGGSASIWGGFKSDSILNEVKDISVNLEPLIGDQLAHIVPDDFIFDLNKIADTSSTIHNYEVNIKIHSKKSPIFLKRKAVIESFDLNDSHFSYSKYDKEFKLMNIKLDSHNLKVDNSSATITLILDTHFIYVRTIDVVYNADYLKEKKVGDIFISVFFDYQDKEYSKLVKIPIVFG